MFLFLFMKVISTASLLQLHTIACSYFKMPRQKISLEIKTRIVDAHNNGEDYEDVARLLGVKRGTAYSIIRRHQQTGQVEQPRGGAHNRKVDAEMTACAIQTVEEHPEYTLLQINRELQTTLPRKPRISIQCLSRLLRNQLIVMKRLETAPVVRNRDDVKQARSAYADWYLQTVNHRHAPEMVFVDESGFNLWISRTRGRAHRGQRAVRIVGNQRGANYTLILVVSARGIVYADFFQSGTTVDLVRSGLPELQVKVGRYSF